MKKIYTIFSILSVFVGFAQIPSGYYSTATGTGYALKTQLRKIIDDANDGLASEHFASDLGYAGLWTTYGTSDRDHQYENDNSVIDLYSENPTGADPYNFTYSTSQCGTYSVEGDCYNREHTVPQSYFGNGVLPMYADAHFILPTDGKVNGWRADHPYGVVGGGTPSPCNSGATNSPCNTANGSKIGNNLNSGYSAGFSGTVFEPVDDFKGDIARLLLYFVTRYENNLPSFYSSSTSEAKVMFDGSTTQSFSTPFLNILLTWHQQDPVSPREIERNNAIYARQNNRNPYIDHPDYVCQIWSSQCSLLSTTSFESLTGINVYPNPSKGNRIYISSEVELNEIEIININGQIIQQIKNPNREQNVYTLENLPQGFYFVKLSAENQSTIKKILVN